MGVLWVIKKKTLVCFLAHFAAVKRSRLFAARKIVAEQSLGTLVASVVVSFGAIGKLLNRLLQHGIDVQTVKMRNSGDDYSVQ
jgi:hypothetical protein